MKPRTLFVGLLVLSAIWAGTAQSVGAQGQTKITFWYTENSSEAPGVLSLIADFETANPDVDVVPEAKKKTAAQIKAGIKAEM